MARERLTVAGLAQVLGRLLRVDMGVLAGAANLPWANVDAWLRGNKGALRVLSIASLMRLLGLDLVDGKWRLDEGRVHFWRVRVGAHGRVDDVLADIAVLSNLLAGCAITRVVPPKRSPQWTLRRYDYYMLSTAQCRVVVVVDRPVWRRVGVTPDIVRGALWRDDNRHHTMRIPSEHWERLLLSDMTTGEFDQAFTLSANAMRWPDLALAARQYNLTPEHLLQWIRERHGEAGDAARAGDTDVEVPAGARGVLLLGSARGRTDWRRTGT